jgi:hypothetical protein
MEPKLVITQATGTYVTAEAGRGAHLTPAPTGPSKPVAAPASTGTRHPHLRLV